MGRLACKERITERRGGINHVCTERERERERGREGGRERIRSGQDR